MFVALAALILAAEAAEPSRASRALLPIARVSDSVTLVQGPRRVAFVVGDDGWFTIDERGFTNAADVARSLYAHAGALEGDLKTMLWARTPAVAVGEKVARAGAKKPIKAPGVIESVIALGSDKELWHYSSGFSGRVAIVDAKDRVKAVAPLASIGKGVPGAIPGVCGAPSAWRAARTADGVAVIHMECHVETPLRLQLIKSDGTSTVRSLQSTSAAGRFEPRQFAVAKDGTPVLAGVLSSKLVIARAAVDGTWSLTKTTIPCVEATAIAVADDGAVWTLALGAGPDGKDRWTVARDGVAIDVKDPSGVDIVPWELAFDEKLGVVVEASLRDLDAPRWILAQRRPGSGPGAGIVELH